MRIDEARDLPVNAFLCAAPSPFTWSSVKNFGSISPQQAHFPPSVVITSTFV
jgi:hypothetical protein